MALEHTAVRQDACLAELRQDLVVGDPGRRRIDRDIELSGNLTPEQRAKLLEIADKCPVHRTLTRGMIIQTRLV